MKAKYVLMALCMAFPAAANADIKYRVEQTTLPKSAPEYRTDNEAFARQHRFYAGAMYNFAMWESFTSDEDVFAGGKNASSFEGVVGVRPYDIFRVELNYIHNDAKWSGFSLTSETAMINALFDARIDSLYRLFYTQKLVPYVGAGAGMSWNQADHIGISRKYTPSVAALAGLGIELSSWFTIDLGYRYFYMFTPDFDGVSGLNPTSHQFRAGVRVNF